ncbi:Glycosyltransferase family 87 [Propionibacterium ruminifibrarum]|uniref:Glycosyltransferase family 87 n=1 Tax=Propionibacterium ruminifibrarum TaxID=1962131 RepID=A0A375HZM6_9ACTN|nr:glycosyltransferase 87 family protein [Propionibacterium ruminifibrarum]SPF67211.1 Glycosyltransferase family 87 [Propionibacterium ruminifibrarum]
MTADQPLIGTGATAATPSGLSTRISRQITLAFTRERLQSGRFLLFFWFVARLVICCIWAFLTPSTQGDVVYYYEKIQVLFDSGPASTLTEYPTPVIALLVVPYLLGFGTQHGYVVAFALMMLALDAAFTWSLWHTGGAMKGQAVVFWTLFLALVGPTAYLRFDLLTSVLAGWSVIFLLRRHHVTAGALTAAGAAVKLWPALLWPALLPGSRRQKITTTAGFAVTGIVLVLASIGFAGWDRLMSPLHWQSGRGLQIESIAATPPMLGRALGTGDYVVTLSRYQAYEIWGPGVSAIVAVADMAFYVGIVAALLAYLVWLWRGHGRIIEAVALLQLVILIMIVTNKTFSPQYIMWIGGPQAAAYAVLGARSQRTESFFTDRSRMNAISMWMLVATAFTLLVYPLSYDRLVSDWNVSDELLRLPATVLLALRNVAVVIVLGLVVRWVWSYLRPSAVRAVRARRGGTVLPPGPGR